MFVVFEGIDGSGKTTVSNQVAKLLRARGIDLEHVREGGEFSSPLVTRLRQFGKAPTNLALEPFPEMLLYLTREAQLTAECTRPALARGGVVFADRYLYSYQALGEFGRRLDGQRLSSLIDAVAGGLWPDLVVLLDVDPHLARARRRASKLLARGQGRRQPGGGSRKGLAGIGVNHRVRQGYLELAARDPERWLVVDNSGGETLEAMCQRIAELIAETFAGAPMAKALATARAGDKSTGNGVDVTVESAEQRFFSWVEARATTEPDVAAYFLAGMVHPRAAELRESFMERAPHLVAYGLRGLGDEAAWAMRGKLREESSYFVARSLDGSMVEGPRAEALRAELVLKEPEAVLATLDGQASAHAWKLREQLRDKHFAAVIESLKRIDGFTAWELREWYLAQAGGDKALVDPVVAGPLVSSVRGLATERAWQLRQLVFDCVPVETLSSLADVFDDLSWQWRDRWVERAAKIVLRTFDGTDDARAWQLRTRMVGMAKEAIDSIWGMDQPQSWTLRQRATDDWPSTVAKSLGPLANDKRGHDLCQDLLQANPSNLSLLKHVTELSARAQMESIDDDD